MPEDNVNPVRSTNISDMENNASNGVKAVIEALLFASAQPLTLEKIKEVLGDFQTTQIRKLLEELGQEFEKSNRGIRIAELAGGFQLITPPDLALFLKKLYKGRRIERLSRPALETLAVIAYKQPVDKLEIGSIRNVNIDGVVKSLIDKDLIRIAGRKKSPGRPFLFGTTRKFLEYFGLKSLEELPRVENFQEALAKEATKKE